MRTIFIIAILVIFPGIARSQVTHVDSLAHAQQMSAVRAEALLVRGLTRSFLGDYEAAMRLLEEALQLAPDSPTILSAVAEARSSSGDPESAVYYARRAAETGADVSYDYRLAQTLLAAARTSDAIEVLSRILASQPDETNALRLLAHAYAASDRSALAIEALERAVAVDDKSIAIRRELLQLYMRAGETERSITLLRGMVRLEPETDDYPAMLAEQLVNAGQRVEALTFLDSLVARDPDRHTIRNLRRELTRGLEPTQIPESNDANLLARAEQLVSGLGPGESSVEADSILQVLLSTDSRNEAALLLSAQRSFVIGDTVAAAGFLERVLAVNPREPSLWLQTALAYFSDGQVDHALDVAEDGILLFPGDIELLLFRGRAAMNGDNPETARRDLVSALDVVNEATPPVPLRKAEIIELLGDLEALTGNGDEARRLWQQALRLNPDDPRLRSKTEQLAH